MPVVKLYANLRNLAGTKELTITGATVGAVLNELVRQKPSVGEKILKNGEIGPHVIVTLNGENLIDLETAVKERDVVAIFPPIAGGTSPLTPTPRREGN
jgi:molybdopterin synthase sulfur carrier subunit